MPQKEIEVFVRGGGSYRASECPLEKFRLDTDGGAGCYTSDPLEACLSCNFGDFPRTRFEDVCQCPADITWEEYDRLRGAYVKAGEQSKTLLTKTGFWEFVKENRIATAVASG